MAVGGGVIGALRVVLGADTAAFETGLKKGASSLDRFAATARKAGIAIAGAMSLAAVGLGMAIKGTLQEADKLGKMAQSIGVPVEELSKLKYAADLSGVSVESLGKGLGRLNRNLVEGAQGLSTPIRAFEALGISIRNTDGSLKTVSQALPEIAEKFSKMRDGPEKTALAMQLLGRAGAELIPMLNLGSAGLLMMTKRAEELGLVFTNQMVNAATAFNDNMRDMRLILNGIVIQVTGALAPALAMFSGALLNIAKNSDMAKMFAEGLVAVIKGAVTAAYTAAIAFRRLGAELSAVWEALNGATRADRLKGWENLRIEGEKTKEQFAAIPQVLSKFWSDAEEAAKKYAATTTGGAGKPNIEDARATTQALKDQKDAAREATRAWEQMWQEGNRVWEQTRTPLEQFNAEVQRLNELMQAGVITGDTYSRAIAQLQDNLSGASQFASSFASSMESAFVNVVAEGKKVSEVAQQLLKDFARLAAQMAFRSLLGGMGGLFGGGGGFKLPGFASGGSFQVGGSGGIDSQLVAFKASPNERVSVTKPGQEMGGGQNVTIVNHNDFRGVDPSMRAWIMQQQQISERRIMAQVPSTVSRHRAHNPSYLRGGG